MYLPWIIRYLTDMRITRSKNAAVLNLRKIGGVKLELDVRHIGTQTHVS